MKQIHEAVGQPVRQGEDQGDARDGVDGIGDQEPAERRRTMPRQIKTGVRIPGGGGRSEDADAVLFDVFFPIFRNLSGGRTYFWINFTLMSRIPSGRRSVKDAFAQTTAKISWEHDPPPEPGLRVAVGPADEEPASGDRDFLPGGRPNAPMMVPNTTRYFQKSADVIIRDGPRAEAVARDSVQQPRAVGRAVCPATHARSAAATLTPMILLIDNYDRSPTTRHGSEN